MKKNNHMDTWKRHGSGVPGGVDYKRVDLL